MAIICPAILAEDEQEYKKQIENIATSATRIQIDLTDGVFATSKTIKISQVWLPHNLKADLHLMYKNPINYIDDAINLNPSLIIVHAEAEGNFFEIAQRVKTSGIKIGICLLPETPVSTIHPIINQLDHVLIFSGNLGHFGGTANLHLTKKVGELKQIRHNLEVGWDGGVNDENALLLVKAGVDVLNSGGYIQNSKNPKSVYNKLLTSIHQVVL